MITSPCHLCFSDPSKPPAPYDGQDSTKRRGFVRHLRMAGMATADRPVTMPSTMMPRYTDSTACSSRTNEPILAQIIHFFLQEILDSSLSHKYLAIGPIDEQQRRVFLHLSDYFHPLLKCRYLVLSGSGYAPTAEMQKAQKLAQAHFLDSKDQHKKYLNPTIFKFATKQRNYLQKLHSCCDFKKHAH